MSASVSCVVFAIRRRSFPTRRVSNTNIGISANANSASFQFSTQHADHRRGDGRHVRRDRRRRVRDDVLHAADVVRDPRLHLARPRAREEGKRQALQMPEDGGAQIVHHPLADLIGKQRLDHAEHPGHDRDHDDPGGVERKRRRVVLLDRLEDVLEQERRDDAEAGRNDDQHQDSSEAPLVRREEPADAVQVRAAHLRVGGTLRRRIRGVKEHAHRHQGTSPGRIEVTWAYGS